MKIKLLAFTLFLFITLPSHTSAQFAPESDPHRGIYVDGFVKLNPANTAVDEALSILSVDKDHDGIFEKEDEVLRYACQNHITYLALYDTHKILGRGRTAWNELTKQNEDLEKHLCRFIQKAKTQYGVTQIGAIGGSPQYFDSVATYMDRYPLSSPIHLDSAIVNNPHFNERLRIVERQFHQPSAEAMKAEFLKHELNVIAFNANNQCEASIDVLNVEYEFWFDCQNEMANFYDILVSMNAVKQIYNSTHPNHQLTTEGYLAQMYFCNGAINLYNAAQALDGCNNCAPIAGTNNPHPPMLDRALYSILQNNPYTFPWSEFNAFENSSTQDSTDFHPMFYSECHQYGGIFNYMGSWLAASPLNTIFLAENYFFYHFLNYANSPLGTPRQNDVQAGGAHWFTSSFMVGHLDNPPVVQPYGTYCTGTGSARLNLIYYGPNEIGTDYEFYITNNVDQSVAYPANGQAITGTSVSSIPHPELGSINLNDSTIFPPMILPSGEYTVHLNLHYNHSTGCTYEATCNVVISDQPTIQVVGDTAFCEGNHTFLIAPQGANYQWQKNGTAIPNATTNTLAVYDDGDYTCLISNSPCSGVSNSIHITVHPNPNVWISSHCNGNGTITLRTNLDPYDPTSTEIYGNNGSTYHWQTGETTDQITITAPSSPVNYYVVVTNPYSGCSIKRAHRIPANADSLTANLYVITNPSSPCSNDGAIGAELLPAVAVSGQPSYLWSNGAITQSISNVPPGTYSCVMSVMNNGCSSYGTITIGNPPTNPPSIIAAFTYPSCSNSHNGAIALTTNGGNAPFNYHWKNIPNENGYDPTTPNQNNLFPGTYQLEVVDAGGCTYTFTYELGAINRSPIASITSITPVSGCSSNANGSATVSASGGTSPYTFSWHDAQNQIASTAINLAAGSYNVITTDAAGCTSTLPVHIPTTNLAIEVTRLDSGIATINCSTISDGSIYVSITGGTAPYTVNAPWSISNEIASQTNLAMGNYTLTVTDNSGCTVSTPFIIDENSLNASLLPSSTPVLDCPGIDDGMINLLIGGGIPPYTVSNPWTINGDTAIQVNLAAGAYPLTLTDANNCVVNNQFIIFPSTYSVSLSNTPTTCIACNNGSIEVMPTNGLAPYSITHTPALGSLNGNTIENLPAGQYIVCVTDAGNCQVCVTDTIFEDPTYIHNQDTPAFIVYPNPSSGTITIQSNLFRTEECSIKFFDLQGKVVLEQKTGLRPSLTLDISFLAPSIYTLEVATSERAVYRGKVAVD